MSYPPQGQNAHHNDPRQYQPRTVAPQVSLDEVVHTAPTLGQYFRSDTRGVPGARRQRWAGTIAFWLGLISIPMFWLLGVAIGLSVFTFAAAAVSVVAIFFGLVAVVAGIGRVPGFFGIVLALIGNTYVIAWLLTALGN
jgi:hypothetical protein